MGLGLSASTVIGPVTYLAHRYNLRYATIGASLGCFAYAVNLGKGDSLAHARPSSMPEDRDPETWR